MIGKSLLNPFDSFSDSICLIWPEAQLALLGPTEFLNQTTQMQFSFTNDLFQFIFSLVHV